MLRRDLFVCRIVEGCPKRATLADHILPVTPDTPDWLFFDPANLRAGCRDHNLARVTEPLNQAAASAESAVVKRDYS